MPHGQMTAVDVVRRFRGLRALVVGDAMLDSYLEGVATRLCKEGPVPVLEKVAEDHAPGGAANAAANLRALGADVFFVGLVGRDEAGRALRATLRARDVDDHWLVADESCATIRKTRVIANDQYVVRFDEGGTRSCGDAGRRCVLRNVEEVFARCDLVVVSDYGYGVAAVEVIDRLRALRATRPLVMAVDTKHVRRFATAGATLIAPNFQEAVAAVEPDAAPTAAATPGEAERIGRRLAATVDAELVAVTLAGEGVMLLDRAGNATHLPAHRVTRAGDVGAGDTFTGATALALAVGADPTLAAHIGIDAAGIAVTQRRTAVVRHQDLLRRVSLADSSPSHSLKSLATILAAERYAGKTIVFTNGVFDILHAGHVRILRQAKALGDVLVVGINSDASTRRLKGQARPINNERDRLALVAALDPVDHALLFEEDTPANLIRALRPDVHVKGGDYTPESLPEADAAREVGARIEIISLVDGRSTTNVIRKIVTLAADGVFGAAP